MAKDFLDPDDARSYEWHIEPHYDSDFDVLVTNMDDAWDELIKVVENVYDNMEPGEERTITIRRRKVERPAAEKEACLKCDGHGWVQQCDGPSGHEEPCECSAETRAAGETDERRS